MQVRDGFVLFWDGPFSNFDMSEFVYQDHAFFCSEQAFMYEKAIFFGDIATAEKILFECYSPADAKRLGRQVKNYDEARWEAARYQIMLDVCRAKFTQSAIHREALLRYGAKGTLVEASPFDGIWGIRLGEDHPDATVPSKWRGRNLLGEVLNELYCELVR